MRKFSPRHIEVGARYKHSQHPNVVYLGVGYSHKCDGTFEKKYLLITNAIGFDNHLVVPPGRDEGMKNFWTGFYKI